MPLTENIRQLYKYRALVGALVVRHLSIRYRGSVLGFLWSFLNPLCLMLVYTIVFKYYIRFNQVEHYTIVLFCGLLPWIWFSTALLEGTSAIVSGGHLITKSMFPAQILPAVAVITSMVNFLLSLPLLFIFMAVGGMAFHWTLLGIPFLVLMQVLFLYGISLGASALNVHFRDVQHLLGNLLSFLFFLCPIVYPPETVPERFRFTLEWNPAALMVVFYNDLIVKGVVPPLHSIAILVGFVVVSLAAGAAVYERYRESFAELL